MTVAAIVIGLFLLLWLFSGSLTAAIYGTWITLRIPVFAIGGIIAFFLGELFISLICITLAVYWLGEIEKKVEDDYKTGKR